MQNSPEVKISKQDLLDILLSIFPVAETIHLAIDDVIQQAKNFDVLLMVLPDLIKVFSASAVLAFFLIHTEGVSLADSDLLPFLGHLVAYVGAVLLQQKSVSDTREKLAQEAELSDTP